MVEDYSDEQIRKIALSDLLLKQIESLMIQKVELLTIAGDFSREGKVGRDARLKAVMNTAGNKETNDLLVKYLGLLMYEIHDKFPNPEYLEMRKDQADLAFLTAVSGHFQEYEDIIKSRLTETFGHEFVEEGGGQAISRRMLRRLKKQRKELETIRKLESQNE